MTIIGASQVQVFHCLNFIYAVCQDPNWYKARRLDGEEGMIPISYVSISQSPTASSPPPLKPKATQVKQATDPLDMP